MCVLIVLFSSVTLSIGFAISASKDQTMNKSDEIRHKLLLIGASVGYGWDLPNFHSRVHSEEFSFEMVPVYQFDKSQALEEVLMRPKRKFKLNRTYLMGFFKPAPEKPEAIIFKECAAYFAGNFDSYKLLIENWVQKCTIFGIRPIICTIVPVTKTHSLERKGRLEGIIEYNTWVRDYAKEKNIPVIDLEAVLRISDREKALKDEYTNGDGLHLNKNAYDVLDKYLFRRLKEILG
jgi:hypothetical protein